MSFISDLQTSDLNELQNVKIVHLLFPDQQLADAFCEQLDMLSSRLFVNRLAIRLFVYDTDQNLCLKYLADLAETDLAILVGSHSKSLKLAYDHLQLIGDAFSLASLTPGFGGNDGPLKDLVKLGRPALTDYALLGIQEHLLHEDPQDSNASLYQVHLAAIAQDLSSAEPIVRRATLCHVDAALLVGPLNGVVGLSAQELAQIVHYAGRGSESKLLALTHASASDAWALKALATISWYFIYGLLLRHAQMLTQMQEYHVEGPIEERSLSFYRNNSTQHWWCHDKLNARSEKLLPCRYEDYNHVITQQELTPWLEFILTLEEGVV